MRLIITITIYVLCFLMFFVRRERKLDILMVYAICLISVPINHATIINPVVFFLLSEIRYLRQYIQAPRRYNLRLFLGVILIGCVLLIINSPHLRSVQELLGFVKTELLYKYLLLFVPLLVLNRKRDVKSIVSPVFLSLLILTFFGIWNLLTQHADFVDWSLEGQELNDVTEDAGAFYSDRDRFRVQAMHFNPFNYGFICIALMLFFYYLKKENSINRNVFLIAISCCLFGIVFCGCRTLILCTAVGIFCIYVMTHSLKKTMWMMALFFILLYLAYLYVPAVNEKVETMVLSVFDTKMRSDVEGSSIAMRTYQLMAVLAHIQGNFYFGLGYNYFNIDIGWMDSSVSEINEDLEGLEGVYLNLLLERGIVGLFIYLFFMFVLMRKFFLYRKSDVNDSTFCLSLCVVYLAFAFITGELSAAFITFLLLGIGMKVHSVKNIV